MIKPNGEARPLIAVRVSGSKPIEQGGALQSRQAVCGGNSARRHGLPPFSSVARSGRKKAR